MQLAQRRLIRSEQIEIQWGHGDDSFEIAIHGPQREAILKRGGGNQEISKRDALAFPGKLMAQAGCPLPCLIQA